MFQRPDWISQLVPGNRVYLNYGGKDECWHERILLAHIELSRWVVVTPDLDIYEEDICDVVSLERGGVCGGVPQRIRYARSKQRLVEFGPLGDARVQGWMRQGEALAAQLRPRGGAFGPDVAVDALRGAEEGAGPIAAAHRLRGKQPPPREHPPAPPPSAPSVAELLRVAAEGRDGLAIGDPLPPRFISVAVQGDRAIFKSHAGVYIVAAEAGSLSISTPRAGPQLPVAGTADRAPPEAQDSPEDLATAPAAPPDSPGGLQCSAQARPDLCKRGLSAVGDAI